MCLFEVGIVCNRNLEVFLRIFKLAGFAVNLSQFVCCVCIARIKLQFLLELGGCLDNIGAVSLCLRAGQQGTADAEMNIRVIGIDLQHFAVFAGRGVSCSLGLLGFCGCDNAAIHARTNLICSLAPRCRARRLRRIAATRTDSVLF